MNNNRPLTLKIKHFCAPKKCPSVTKLLWLTKGRHTGRHGVEKCLPHNSEEFRCA